MDLVEEDGLIGVYRGRNFHMKANFTLEVIRKVEKCADDVGKGNGGGLFVKVKNSIMEEEM